MEEQNSIREELRKKLELQIDNLEKYNARLKKILGLSELNKSCNIKMKTKSNLKMKKLLVCDIVILLFFIIMKHKKNLKSMKMLP